jgi:predicted RNA binding protein YcfA (HicA-like mRNA interferase family)
MTKLPSVTGKELVSILKKAGFEIIRQKGNHVFLRHSDGRVTVVPVHKGETIGIGLLLYLYVPYQIYRLMTLF